MILSVLIILYGVFVYNQYGYELICYQIILCFEKGRKKVIASNKFTITNNRLKRNLDIVNYNI